MELKSNVNAPQLPATAVTQPALPAHQQFTFTELKELAKMIAVSNLLGAKTPEQAMVVMMLAQSEGVNPVQAAMDYSIIQGRPALNSQACLTRFQKAGGRVKYIERTDTKCTIEFSHPSAETLTITWDMQRAAQAGLNTNKENWRKYPRQMLSARCIAEGVRACYPACLNGSYLVEEVEEFAATSAPSMPQQPQANAKPIHTNAIEALPKKEIDYKMSPRGKKWTDMSQSELYEARKFLEGYKGSKYSKDDIAKYFAEIDTAVNKLIEENSKNEMPTTEIDADADLPFDDGN